MPIATRINSLKITHKMSGNASEDKRQKIEMVDNARVRINWFIDQEDEGHDGELEEKLLNLGVRVSGADYRVEWLEKEIAKAKGSDATDRTRRHEKELVKAKEELVNAWKDEKVCEIQLACAKEVAKYYRDVIDALKVQYPRLNEDDSD